MPGVHRKTDISTGHDICPPIIPKTWSPDTFVNNLNVIRQTDTRSQHFCYYHKPHTGTYMGVHTVFVNNKCIQVKDDPIVDPFGIDKCLMCSLDTFVN